MFTRFALLAFAVYLVPSVQPFLNQALADSQFAIWTPGLVVFTAICLCSRSGALLASALAGFLCDCVGSGTLGVVMITLTAVTFVVQKLIRTRPAFGIATVAVVTAVITFCSLLASLMGQSLHSRTPADGAHLLSLAVRHSIGNVVVVVLGMLMIRRFVGLFGKFYSPVPVGGMR